MGWGNGNGKSENLDPAEKTSLRFIPLHAMRAQPNPPAASPPHCPTAMTLTRCMRLQPQDARASTLGRAASAARSVAEPPRRSARLGGIPVAGGLLPARVLSGAPVLAMPVAAALGVSPARMEGMQPTR